jgi:hypothetical protein
MEVLKSCFNFDRLIRVQVNIHIFCSGIGSNR